MSGADVGLIGGEMVTWTDDDPERDRVPAGGPLLLELLKRALPSASRVLVAGPHQQTLVDVIVAGAAEVTCLVRSLPDAEALALRHPSVTVVCGGLDKFTTTEPYDVVVALDGMDRLGSVDGADLSWTESLARLTRALGPDGLLLLALENEFGVHRLVDPALPDAVSDGDWRPVFGHDATRPADPDRLAATLDLEGLTVQGAYAGYPLPRTPSVLAATSLFDSAELLGPLIAAACARGFAGREILSDPRRTARDAIRTGLGVRLAPQWFVVARRSAEPAVLPELLVADETAGLWEIVRDGDGYARRLLTAPDWTSGRVQRDLPTAYPVPGGITLEELLLDACAREDIPRVRELLRDFAGWLAGQEPAVQPFATTDNVVVEGIRFALLAPGFRLVEPVPSEHALARVLRRFAVRLVAGGYRHPWPAGHSVDGLVLIWLSMAGHPLDREDLPAVAELEVSITGSAEDPAPPLGRRELLAEVDRLRQEADAANSRLAGFQRALERTDRELTERVRQLEKMRQELKAAKTTLAALRSSLPYRVGRVVKRSPAKIRRFVRKPKNF
jgi:hypothetical protein